MDISGVRLHHLQDISDRLDKWSTGTRYLYQGTTGVQLPNNVFQRREYDGNTILRAESQLSDAEWDSATPIKAAVGDRVAWAGHVGAVISVTNDEYIVRPAKTPEKFGHEINYAHWDWGDAIMLRDFDRVTVMTTKGVPSAAWARMTGSR